MKIPRGDWERPDLSPSWLAIQNHDGTPHKPIIRCRCGKLFGIRLHHVHADGQVTASFYHPEVPLTAGSSDQEPGCGFHEFLELEGYDGPEWVPT